MTVGSSDGELDELVESETHPSSIPEKQNIVLHFPVALAVAALEGVGVEVAGSEPGDGFFHEPLAFVHGGEAGFHEDGVDFGGGLVPRRRGLLFRSLGYRS